MPIAPVRPLSLALLFFALLGCSLLVFGISYLLLSPKTKDPRVEEYNTRVDLWKSKYRQRMSKYRFNVTVLDIQRSKNFPFLPKHEQMFEMIQDETPDKLYKEYFYSLHKYEALKYTLDQDKLLGSVPLSINFTQTIDITITYEYTGDMTLGNHEKSDGETLSSLLTTTKTTKRKSLQVPKREEPLLAPRVVVQQYRPDLKRVVEEEMDWPIELMKDDSVGAESYVSQGRSNSQERGAVINYPIFIKLRYRDTDCQYGFLEGNQCYLVYKLQSLCFKVNEVSPGELALDDEYGGYGCAPTDKYFRTVFTHNWVAAKYMFLNVRNTSTIHNETTDFNELTALVRSVRDPLVYAEFITNGTLNFNGFFGPGSGLYISTTRGFISFGSIGIGAFIAFPALICFGFVCMRPKKVEEKKRLIKANDGNRRGAVNWESYLFPKSSFSSDDT